MAGHWKYQCTCIYFIICITLYPVASEPSWNLRPQDSRVLIGRNITLFCQINNVGDSSVVWQKDVDILFINHERQLADQRYHITGQRARGQFNLLITNAEQTDDHTYRCTVGTVGLVQDAHLTVIVPPGTPSISVDRTGDLIAGQTVRLTCVTSGGNPLPMVKWFRAGRQITGPSVVDSPAQQRFGTSRSVLTWRLTGNDHNTVFTCTVENEGNNGNPIGASYRMNVQFGPVVRFEPGVAVRVLSGQSITLRCVVTANPPVSSVAWFKDGIQQTETGMTYIIRSVMRSQVSSVYECVAANKIGEGRNISTVTAIYPPQITIPETNNGQVVVNESTTVRLTCNVDAHPPADTVTWRKVGSSSTVSGTSLVLQNIGKSDAGIYVCEATNTLNPTGGVVSMITRNATISVQVQYPPGEAIIAQITPGKVVTGQNVRLRCTVQVSGFPKASLYWTKEDDPTFTADGPDLILYSVKMTANGVYVCVARNILAEGSAGKYQLKVYEQVSLVSPLLETVKYMSVLDRDMSVMCEARGNPVPQITWYRNGQAIPKSSTRFTVTATDHRVDTYSYIVTSQLQWKGPSRMPKPDSITQADAANYTCLASNMAEYETSRTVQIIIYYPPVVQVTTRRVAINIGESVTLTCEGHSLPSPEIKWMHKINQVREDNRRKISHFFTTRNSVKNQLIIKGIQERDLGIYTCVGTNYLGNMSNSVTVSRRGVPGKPTDVRVTAVTWETAILRWVPGFDGGYPQTFIVIYSSPDYPSQKIYINSSHVSSQEITGLFPSTGYSFIIYGQNKLGKGPNSNPVSVLTKSFHISPPKQVVFKRGKDMLTFSSVSLNTCVRIETSQDGQNYELYKACVPLSGGSLKLSVGQVVTHVNISACLIRRPDVCSLPVAAKMEGAVIPQEALPVTALIIVGSISGVVIVVLVLILVILCWRRKYTAGGLGSSVQSSRPYHQAIITVESTDNIHAKDNDGMHVEQLHPDKTFIMSDNHSYKDSRRPNTDYIMDNHDHLTGKPPWHPRSCNNNSAGKSHATTQSPRQTSGQRYPKPVRNMESLNSSHDSAPYTQTICPKHDTHSNSSEESGYSTPTKSKKVIHEIVV